jgi:serine/threonine protein phosphatase PrpC
VLIIESKVYSFSLGDCKGYTFRGDVVYQLNLDHLPVYIYLVRAEETREFELKMLVGLFNMID